MKRIFNQTDFDWFYKQRSLISNKAIKYLFLQLFFVLTISVPVASAQEVWRTSIDSIWDSASRMAYTANGEFYYLYISTDDDPLRCLGNNDRTRQVTGKLF